MRWKLPTITKNNDLFRHASPPRISPFRTCCQEATLCTNQEGGRRDAGTGTSTHDGMNRLGRRQLCDGVREQPVRLKCLDGAGRTEMRLFGAFDHVENIMNILQIRAFGVCDGYTAKHRHNAVIRYRVNYKCDTVTSILAVNVLYVFFV